MPHSAACPLSGRCLIRVGGADSPLFLQNLVTNDVMKLEAGQLLYACLLTPQGRILHDFFISRDGEGFYIECETARREDFIRRLSLFKLRAQVTITDCHGRFDVYASQEKPAGESFRDPRLPDLGYRFYRTKAEAPSALVSEETYHDRRIHLGVAEGGNEIKPEADTVAHANLDCLNAISWDKGCYLGQEVTAMTENRGVAKKRFVIVEGKNLKTGAALVQGGGEVVGEIRAVNSRKTEGLALLKLAHLKDITPEDGEKPVSVRLPPWLESRVADLRSGK